MPAMPKPQDADVEAAGPAGDAAGKAAPAAAEEAAKPARKVAEEADPRLRWAFVRKVYAILSLQFALTAAVSVAACLVRAVPRFFATGSPAAVWPVFIGILVSPLIVMFPMLKYREKHPTNLVLLGVFTLCCSLSIAMTTSTSLGRVVLQSAILTAVAVLGLTLFTFWAVKKGYDFTFMFPFLFTCVNVLLVYLVIQIFFPLGRFGITIYGFLATLVFSGFIVYDTHMLLKRHTYNEYVVAAISLYLDVINLFMAQMSLSFQ
ncbi:hypothetical protein GQ55_8G213600 [Panicum hallii var. hallii]|uniref:BI1-like protein n=1 Tax=Panicum hallii var. hallii TaxID=1504633 RepID=A0A2T7CPY4_9POAL|nr:hypothetical protein GQ55_8G213600 [Panicum hallii var. hallii]